MVQHSFLKSIRPVNVLSFGPATEEIELHPLNILIGPNGSGKSNLIEVLRLLYYLPEKEPWRIILNTGGADEWVWKGARGKVQQIEITAKIQWDIPRNERYAAEPLVYQYEIGLDKFQTSFRVSSESIRMSERNDGFSFLNASFKRTGTLGEVHSRNDTTTHVDLISDRSILSEVSSRSLAGTGIGTALPEILEIREFFDSFDFHQDWEFGADLTPRDPVPTGQPIERVEENGSNLAQMIAYFRDFHPQIFQRLSELMGQFYEPFEGLEVRLIGTHLQIAIKEKGGFTTTAYRLSDGTLRWLTLLAILLNPSPAPVTCIEEPELGLHPDMIPTLADLLRDASKRTQITLTTHSQSLVEEFSTEPDSVCVCEKNDGATRIHRLDGERLKVWLKDYSLGQLWASGQIGGNRW